VGGVVKSITRVISLLLVVLDSPLWNSLVMSVPVEVQTVTVRSPVDIVPEDGCPTHATHVLA
jgi:hypothetical protein